MRGFRAAIGLLLGCGFSISAIAAPQPQDGAALYKRCAACHLPTGKGIPGAFPPLAADVVARAQAAEGRKYLGLVIIKGVSGPLLVEGKTYRGVMPAQASLSDEDVAALLNYVVTKVAKGKATEFTASEIAAFRKDGATLNAAAVGKLHTSVAAK
jgi:mono/diheme cytochrome c family protein